MDRPATVGSMASDAVETHWLIRPVMAVDAKQFDNPFVPLQVICNCEQYSPDTGRLVRCDMTVLRPSSDDIEKLEAWLDIQVSVHDHNRRSFAYYELDKIDYESTHEGIVLGLAYQP